MNTVKDTQFSISSTNACKGVSLLFLLWHHLFYQNPEFGFITYKSAVLAKVCVAIFVLLSGYGFSESVKFKKVGLFAFYKKRLAVLYCNYWLIALIFVPIGIVFKGRTLQDVYTGHAYAKFMIQMTGLHRFVYSEFGYNETWWYMSVIIPLIIFFPFLYELTKKYGVLVLIFCVVIVLANRDAVSVIRPWLLPFVLGIYASQRNSIVVISDRLHTYGNWRFMILFFAIVSVAVLKSSIPLLGGSESDWLFGGLIIVFVFEFTTVLGVAGKVLGFLGMHLFNIFLFHTFIYDYYWKEYIYFANNPILIFLALLLSSLVISMAIEQIKRRIYFTELMEKVSAWRVPADVEIAFLQDAPADARPSRR